MHDVATSVRRQLIEKSDPVRRESAQRFFKEDLVCHGVASADVRKIAKREFASLKGQPKRAVLRVCDTLMQSGFLEESGVACEWCFAVRAQFTPEDLTVFELWLDKYVSNWAACDTLCNHSVGALLEMWPETVMRLYEWAVSQNRWKRRGAAASLIIPARKGLFLQDIFALSDILLRDDDDLVRKGCGWVLKAASEAHHAEVFAFLMERKTTMPRTAFRYALEKMPKELREKAMKK